jgi:hypothetical protein
MAGCRAEKTTAHKSDPDQGKLGSPQKDIAFLCLIATTHLIKRIWRRFFKYSAPRSPGAFPYAGRAPQPRLRLRPFPRALLLPTEQPAALLVHEALVHTV